jgi:hypothetical protein
VWTQPPLGLLYSPQTVFQGNFSPQTLGGGLFHWSVKRHGTAEQHGRTDFLSTSLRKVENTLAFMSALPAANRTLFGCQSIDKTVLLIGFLSCLDAHQFMSSSNEQIQMDLAPLATANLFSKGLQRTCVAARLILRTTRVGFQIVWDGLAGLLSLVHTYALRS